LDVVDSLISLILSDKFLDTSPFFVAVPDEHVLEPGVVGGVHSWLVSVLSSEAYDLEVGMSDVVVLEEPMLLEMTSQTVAVKIDKGMGVVSRGIKVNCFVGLDWVSKHFVFDTLINVISRDN
jgi:hypothetical protein